MPSAVNALCYLLANAAPRVILIDARMPEMAGGEFLDQLRAMQRMSHARIVVYMAEATHPRCSARQGQRDPRRPRMSRGSGDRLGGIERPADRLRVAQD